MDAYVDGWRALNRAMRAGDPWSGDEGNAVFLQGRDADGALAMVDVAPLLGLYDLGDGRSVARVDLDFDGDEDLVLTARTAPRVRLHQNRLADRAHWLGLRLEAGEGTNPEALGAVVRIELEGADGEAPRTLRRARRAGSGYLAQSSAWIRVPVGARGAGRAPRGRVTVRWPGPHGVLEDFGELRADRSYALRQGTGRARAVERPSAVGRGAVSPADPPVVASRLRAVLPTPVAVPGFAVRGVASNPARLFGVTPGGARGTGRALCLVVHDGVDEAASLGALSDASTSATEAGAQAAALDLRLVADEGERSRAAERLRAAGWSGAAFFAAHPDTPALLAEVAGWRFDRTDAPPLPWTFVFAPDGRLAVVRSGALEPGDVVRDLAAVKANPETRRTLHAPLAPGHWLRPPTAADLGPLRARLARAGLDAAVRELDLARIEVGASTTDTFDLSMRVGRSLLAQRDPDVPGAVEAFERATAARPESADAWRGLAYALQLDGRTVASIDAWSRALELAPSDVSSLANRGLALAAAGRSDEAEVDAAALDALGESGTAAARAVRAAIEAARAAESEGGR